MQEHRPFGPVKYSRSLVEICSESPVDRCVFLNMEGSPLGVRGPPAHLSDMKGSAKLCTAKSHESCVQDSAGYTFSLSLLNSKPIYLCESLALCFAPK